MLPTCSSRWADHLQGLLANRLQMGEGGLKKKKRKEKVNKTQLARSPIKLKREDSLLQPRLKPGRCISFFFLLFVYRCSRLCDADLLQVRIAIAILILFPASSLLDSDAGCSNGEKTIMDRSGRTWPGPNEGFLGAAYSD